MPIISNAVGNLVKNKVGEPTSTSSKVTKAKAKVLAARVARSVAASSKNFSPVQPKAKRPLTAKEDRARRNNLPAAFSGPNDGDSDLGQSGPNYAFEERAYNKRQGISTKAPAPVAKPPSNAPPPPPPPARPPPPPPPTRPRPQPPQRRVVVRPPPQRVSSPRASAPRASVPDFTSQFAALRKQFAASTKQFAASTKASFAALDVAGKERKTAVNVQAADDQRKVKTQSKRRGRASTILTGGSGLGTSPASEGRSRKTLLGV